MGMRTSDIGLGEQEPVQQPPVVVATESIGVSSTVDSRYGTGPAPDWIKLQQTNFIEVETAPAPTKDPNIEYILRQLMEAYKQIAQLEMMVITGFYEYERPIYRQGLPKHELESVVTAEEVAALSKLVGR